MREVNIIVDTDVQSFAVANLRRRPVVVETGGFVVGLDPDTDSPYINYATPLPGAEPSGRDVAALIETFRGRGLKPRLEFSPGAAPAVEPALRAEGFGTEAEHEYLVCTPETLRMPAAVRAFGQPTEGAASTGVVPVVEIPSTNEDFTAIDAALSEAFSGTFASSPQGAARLRRLQDNGGAVRFVRSPDGGCAGGAGCSAPAHGTCELAGVGTRPLYRGHGIAAAVTAALTETMFAAGAGSVWLEFDGAGSRRVYERVGFAPKGARLYMSLEG